MLISHSFIFCIYHSGILCCFSYTSDYIVCSLKTSCLSQCVCWGRTIVMIHPRSAAPALALTLAAAVPTAWVSTDMDSKSRGQGLPPSISVIKQDHILRTVQEGLSFNSLCGYPTTAIEIFKNGSRGSQPAYWNLPSQMVLVPLEKTEAKARVQVENLWQPKTCHAS